jgi:hypothetical protein
MYLAGDIGRGINDAFKQVQQATQSISSGTFTVNQGNVLAAARIIDSQADALYDLWRQSARGLRVEPPGDDDVSTRIAPAWNDLLVENDDSYQNRVKEYIAALKRLAVQLGDTAKAYGHSEDDIAAAFRTNEGG